MEIDMKNIKYKLSSVCDKEAAPPRNQLGSMGTLRTMASMQANVDTPHFRLLLEIITQLERRHPIRRLR
jgi:hypothetical protein